MNSKVFKSERHFTFFDFLISHGQLLLRSSKGDDSSKNIDIIFFGVRYVQLSTSLSGIVIQVVDDKKNIINCHSVNSFLDYDRNVLFEIVTGNEKFFIVASYFKVYENELAFNETSLGINGGQGQRE